MIDILLKYILWYNFLNDLDAQSDFDKSFVTKKLVKWNHSYCADYWSYQRYIFEKYQLRIRLAKKDSCISYFLMKGFGMALQYWRLSQICLAQSSGIKLEATRGLDWGRHHRRHQDLLRKLRSFLSVRSRGQNIFFK